MEDKPTETSASPSTSKESPDHELLSKTTTALLNKKRALTVLRHCNQVMFEAESEQGLLDEICRIIVDDTGYLLTWVGYPEFNKDKTITPVAHCGYEDGYLESLAVTWSDADCGHGPAGSAIQTGKPYVVRDVHSDPNFEPWRDAAVERGYAAVASLPLFIGEQVPAVILMYAAEVGAFDSDEIALLAHFAEALSFGIKNMRLREKNRQAERSLRASEQRFRFMLDNSPIAVRIAKDNGHNVVYSNQAYNTLTNISREDIIGADPSNFYADKKEYAAIIEELESGQSINNRLVNFSIPGQGDKWTLSTYLAIEYEGEEAVLAWFYDITDRKKVEESLLLSEEEYIKAFRSIPEALAITTIAEGKFIEVNKGCTTLLGYERDELIGHTSTELKIWPDSKHRQQLIELVTSDHEFHDLEVKFQTKSGQISDVLISGEAITINQQNCMIICARDITERKQVQRDFRQLKNYLANIIDSMPSIVIGINNDGTVTQWNNEAQNVTGISVEEAQGKHLPDVFPRLAAEMNRISEAMQTRKELVDAHKPFKQDGEIQYEDITIYPLVANGVDGAVIRIDNVTERVRIEEMMIQSEKMLSVGGLAAGMAHEINNPLAGMMQTANVLNSRLSSKTLAANIAASKETGIDLDALYNYMDKRGVLRMLSAINESSFRIADIIDNMLTFARKSDVLSLPANISTLLDKSLALAATDYDLKKQYDFKSIEIVREYQDKLPQVTCEASKIQQVFLNLFRNGAQAMQTAGTENPKFYLRAMYEKDDDMVTVEVEDNGPGMDETTRKRIFEPFFTTKPEGIGTGLGLSVSYFIITENHGGEMTVVSEPDKGSRFIIRLPISQIEQLNE